MRVKHGIAAIAAAFSMGGVFAGDNSSFVPESRYRAAPISMPAESEARLSAGNPFENQSPSQLGCEETQTFTYYGTTFHACSEDINQQLLNAFTLIGKIKQYEREVLGLEETTNYLEYTPAPSEGVYKLSVVPLSALSTNIRVVNITEDGEYRDAITVPTRLSSMADTLVDEERHYEQAGHEVYRRFTPNFGLGCSLTSELMQRRTVNIIETVLEEDFHWNVRKSWKKLPHRDVEESTANLVSHAAAVGFAKDYFGEDTAIYRQAVKSFDDFNKYALFAVETYNDLESILAMNDTYGKKKEMVDALFEKARRTYWNITNAGALFDALPYTRLFPLAKAVYDNQENVKAFVELMKNLPDNEYGAIGYLERYCNGCSYSPLTRHVVL